MSQIVSIQETLCKNCVHKTIAQSEGLFLCKLLEEELLEGKSECEDFEAFDPDSEQVRACE